MKSIKRMKKTLLRTLFSLTLMALPLAASAAGFVAPVDEAEALTAIDAAEDGGHFDLSVSGGTLQIHALNLQGQVARVYDVVGKLKAEVRIDSNDKTVRVQLGKGIYLVNVNKTTRRISVAG